MNPQDKKFVETLLSLRTRDMDSFMRLVLLSLKEFPDLAMEDDQPKEQKLSALSTMLSYFEQNEEYEECSFIKQLYDAIADEKGTLPSNEQ